MANAVGGAKRRRTPNLDLSVRGVTGLPVYAGRVYDEVVTELQGDRGRRILREMAEQDPIIGGTLLAIEMLARQVPWSLTPADDTDKAQEVADFVDECLTDMFPVFGNTLSEILSMLQYGWSWLEIVYKRRDGMNLNDSRKSSLFEDGKIGWSSWSIRSQESLNYWEWSDGDQGDLVAMHQWAPPRFDRIRLPRSKALHFTTRARRENPEGISILRNSYRPWYMKKNIEVIEAIGIERDLAGLPVLYAPPELFRDDASEADKSLFETLRTIVTSIKRDEQEGILMPLAYDEEGKNPLYKLELLSTAGDRQFSTNDVITRYDERIAMSMLADFILMGHSQVGSFALSTSKTGLFNTALSAFMDVISDEVNRSGIPRLVALNGWDLKLAPALQHGKVEGADLGQLGQFLALLNKAGMQLFPNRSLEEYLLKQAGVPSDPGVGEAPPPGSPDLLPPGALLQLPPGPTAPPQLPSGQPVPPQSPAGNNNQRVRPGGTQPAEPNPRRPRTRVSVAAEPEDDRLVGHEARRHHRHFIPLAARISKINDRLKSAMSPEAYSGLLVEAMNVNKFSKLSAAYQQAIIDAETAASL